MKINIFISIKQKKATKSQKTNTIMRNFNLKKKRKIQMRRLFYLVFKIIFSGPKNLIFILPYIKAMNLE